MNPADNDWYPLDDAPRTARPLTAADLAPYFGAPVAEALIAAGVTGVVSDLAGVARCFLGEHEEALRMGDEAGMLATIRAWVQ